MGVELTQIGFQADVTYALYYNGELVTGSEWTASSTDMSGSYSYGDFSQAGTYTIQGTTKLGECSQQVAEIELVADPLPTAFEVQGEGFYCGPTGMTFITLSGSETSVSYQLMLNNDVEVGTSVARSTVEKMAEQAMWEILGHGLRAHILNLEDEEIEV